MVVEPDMARIRKLVPSDIRATEVPTGADAILSLDPLSVPSVKTNVPSDSCDPVMV